MDKSEQQKTGLMPGLFVFNRERDIEAGSHEIKVEYYEAARNAKVKVSWGKIN
ncbi:MAG: hypothetical protein Q8N21_02240 [bacterium]|nr:hypothetical protein [bacterium]